MIRAPASLLVLALAACALQPSVWHRSDVTEATARGVERDCRQRAIESTAPGNNPADAQVVHLERERSVERCMVGSGFSRKP